MRFSNMGTLLAGVQAYGQNFLGGARQSFKRNALPAFAYGPDRCSQNGESGQKAGLEGAQDCAKVVQTAKGKGISTFLTALGHSGSNKLYFYFYYVNLTPPLIGGVCCRIFGDVA